MFLASSSRLYARETTEEEFIRYVRDNGVSAALQPAMIQLYRLPIKPNNIKEFFAEYLENGACTLTNISLLRAELCYLHSEEENLQLRLKNLDEVLQDMNDSLNVSNIQRASASMIPNSDEIPDLMTRFVEDTKKNPINSYDPFDLSTPNFQVEEDIEASEEEGEAEEEMNMVVTKTSENLERKDSVLDMLDDLKEFDPWGMIFKYYDNDLKYESKTKGNSNNNDKSLLPTDITNKENENRDASIMGESKNSSEDADTLIELFHTKILPDEKIDESFLKEKREKMNFSDLMGWGNYQSKQYNLPPKYPTHISNTTTMLPPMFNDFSGKKQQDFKGSSRMSEEKDRNKKNLIKFYSQMNNGGVTDGKLFNFTIKDQPAVDMYAKGIQTDILEEFEEFAGEDWDWEWDTEDYYLNSEGGKVKSTLISQKDGNGNTFLNEENKEKREILTNNEETLKANFPKKRLNLELYPTVLLRSETKMSTSTLYQPCSSQDEGPKKGRQVKYGIGGIKFLDKTEKNAQKGAKVNTREYTRSSVADSSYSKPINSPLGNRKSAKHLKYIYDTYDADTASKLQQEFDFRIFDD